MKNAVINLCRQVRVEQTAKRALQHLVDVYARTRGICASTFTTAYKTRPVPLLSLLPSGLKVYTPLGDVYVYGGQHIAYASQHLCLHTRDIPFNCEINKPNVVCCAFAFGYYNNCHCDGLP